MTRCPAIAVTPGEPAGIGPDIVLRAALTPPPAVTIAIADPALLEQRAAQLGLPVAIRVCGNTLPPEPAPAGALWVLPTALAAPCRAGQTDSANSRYVIACLDRAIAGCRSGQFDALVTGPVNKAVICEAGIPFSGHTEYLAQQTGTDQVVMMLASNNLRVALATTHLPLRNVSDAIDRERLQRTLDILQHDLVHRFAVPTPRILVLGLNPHAGESGHLGTEETDVIEPVLARCRQRGYRVTGPVPADSAFTARFLQHADAVLAMYHDQGLPVLKSQSFGSTVNVTLGLPIVRTSVDHGTALPLAGGGEADCSSLRAALQMAIELGGRSQGRPGQW